MTRLPSWGCYRQDRSLRLNAEKVEVRLLIPEVSHRDAIDWACSLTDNWSVWSIGLYFFCVVQLWPGSDLEGLTTVQASDIKPVDKKLSHSTTKCRIEMELIIQTIQEPFELSGWLDLVFSARFNCDVAVSAWGSHHQSSTSAIETERESGHSTAKCRIDMKSIG